MNRSKFLIALAAILCMVLSPVLALVPADTTQAQSADSPWPMLGQNAQHTHRSPYSGPEVPKLKWSFTTGDEIFSSPAIGADGTIYVGSLDGKLWAINPDGSPKWSLLTGGEVHSSPAIGADGTIYFGSLDGKLYARNPDGSWKWSFTTGGPISCSPAIGADGTIYVGSYDDNFYAINPTDGSQKWSWSRYSEICSPAIGADGTVYVGSSGGTFFAIDPSDGTKKLMVPTGDQIASSPAIGADDTIYFASLDGSLYAYDAAPYNRKWSFPVGPYVISSPAIATDGTIYVGSGDGKLYAVNPNGTEKWSFATGGWVASSPAVGADGTIYVGSVDDNIYAINPNGSQKWSFTTGGDVTSSPAIGADGTIYVGSCDGKLYAITGEFDLTISSTAGGSVTNPGEGTFTYDRGTVVNLIAQAEAGYRFVNWTGDVGTVADVYDATTTITMDGDFSITANFEQIPAGQFDLTTSSTTGGSVTNPGEGTFPYQEGTVVNLVAEAEEGYLFVEWTGDVDRIADVNAAETTIKMEGKYEIAARFEQSVAPGGCFVATAAYGTPMADEIEILREFRDGYLLTNPAGQVLVELYYRASPPIAEFITEHPGLKPAVRAGLLPTVAMSAVAVNTSPAEKMAVVGFLVLVSVAVALWGKKRLGRGTQYT
jgi:outer membrane protein assembly factor BamB